MSPCIVGLTTQDPYILKEHIELYKILKFRVNQANTEQDTIIQKLQNLLRNAWISGQVFNIGPIDTKLKDFVKLDVFFQNIWILCC